MAALPRFPTKGPSLIDGTSLDAMVDQINSITGAAGSAGPLAATTLTVSSTGTFNGTLKTTGLITATAKGLDGLIGSTAGGATARLGNFTGSRQVVTTVSTTAGVKSAIGILRVTTTAVKTYKLGAPTKGLEYTLTNGNSTGVTFGTTSGIVFQSTSGAGRTSIVMKSKYASITLVGLTSTNSQVIGSRGTITV